jgi:hypothetical protein
MRGVSEDDLSAHDKTAERAFAKGKEVFCGKEGVGSFPLRFVREGGWTHIWCGSCGVLGSEWNNEVEALEAWNKRVGEGDAPLPHA